MKRTNKTIEEQSKYYEVEDFKFWLIEQWNYGYNIYKYYMELSVNERFKFIEWLLIERINEWEQILLYLLNPKTKRNNGNR